LAWSGGFGGGVTMRKTLSIGILGAVLVALVLGPAASLGQAPLTPQFTVRTRAIVSGAAILSGTNTSSLIAAQGAGIRTFITQVHCVNSSASTVTVGRVLDGTTVLAYVPCPATSAVGSVTTFSPPLVGTANTALGMAVTVSATTAYATAMGYIGTQP
jgi:hypothetical protein